MKVNGRSDGFEITNGNYAFNFNELYVFLTHDPHFEIHASEVIASVHLELYMDSSRPIWSFCNGHAKDLAVHEARASVQAELEALMLEYYRQTETLNMVHASHEELVKELSNLRNSGSWRYTKIFRKWPKSSR